MALQFKALSQWKKVQVNAASIGVDDSEFDGFGGLEVLENYEVYQAENADSKKSPNENGTRKKKNKTKSKPDNIKETDLHTGIAVTDKTIKKKKRKRKLEAVDSSESVSVKSKVKKTHDKQPHRDSLFKDMQAWKDLFIPECVLQSLHDLGFISPTLIQALTLPAAIRDRKDILGAAETGSGKTLAFGIPVVEKILKMKRDGNSEQREKTLCALVLTPTRELCVQVRDHLCSITNHTDIKVVAVFGGLSSQKQVRLLKQKPEVIVATPGRLWDVLQQESDTPYFKSVIKTPVLVIDEADRMIEKGHFEELTRILTLMKGDEEVSVNRQSFVFSATLMFVHSAPERLKTKKKKKKYNLTPQSKIEELIEAVGILKKPKVIDITNKSQTAERLVESCVFCAQKEKDLYLYYFLSRHPGRTLIFTNSIDCIRRLLSLFNLLNINLLPLHANMHQKQRLKNLERFKENANAVLLATDVAARGLDIPNIEHVIHYQIPRTTEGYVHRSGRTARAQNEGLSVMIVDEKEIQNYKKIAKSLDKG